MIREMLQLPLREEGDIMGRLGDNHSKGDQFSGECCLSGKRETLWSDRGIIIVKETNGQGNAASQGIETLWGDRGIIIVKETSGQGNAAS